MQLNADQSRKEKVLRIGIKVFIITKILYNYLDIGTDIYLLYELYQVYGNNNTSRFTSILFLILCQFYERKFTFEMLQQLYTQ